LALWFQASLKRQFHGLEVTSGVAKQFGITPASKSRAFDHLEAAGLLRVERNATKPAVVEVLTPGVGFGGADPDDIWIDGEFVRGNLPLAWWQPACRIPGSKSVLATALGIWFLSGLNSNNLKRLKLTTDTVARFDVDHQSKLRALRALEAAKLVQVEWRFKKTPFVTVVEVKNAEANVN
jgi:hypothetical protein